MTGRIENRVRKNTGVVETCIVRSDGKIIGFGEGSEMPKIYLKNGRFADAEWSFSKESDYEPIDKSGLIKYPETKGVTLTQLVLEAVKSGRVTVPQGEELIQSLTP